jgi:hypothetical protein
MLNLNNVTLICVDTVDLNRVLKSIDKSTAVAKFTNIYIFTDNIPIETTYSNNQKITFIKIDKLKNIQQYSAFMMKMLGKYLTKNVNFFGHILIVQHDSWIVNPKSWTDEFLEYDYIGAPFACHPELTQGNGGFSLRSIKLCKHLFKDYKIQNIFEEDNNICHEYRSYLELQGFKFAPEELAAKFSVEGRPITNQFGQHCADKIEIGTDQNGTRKIYIQDKVKVYPENGFAYTLPIKPINNIELKQFGIILNEN